MVYINFNAFLALSTLASLVSAAPLPMQRRIAQTIADSTAKWEQACLKAGGAAKCNPISQTAFTSLLAAGKNCDQQDAADSMIDLAKTLNNDPDMIRLAQIFVQQPRNAPDSLQVPYCQKAPKNPELNGLFHCQFAGSNFAKFSGDQTGNLPLGVAAVNPPGSCPAKPDGPVPDGVQLNTLVDSPGTPAAGEATGVQTPDETPDAETPDAQTGDRPNAATTSVAAAPPANTNVAANTNGKNTPPVRVATQGQGNTDTTDPAPVANPDAKPFTLANGQDAKALNAEFAGLTADSACTDGKQACINGQFAQCVGGKFILTPCGGGAQCFALPLVNSRGTSITCSNPAEAQARIAATGA